MMIAEEYPELLREIVFC